MFCLLSLSVSVCAPSAGFFYCLGHSSESVAGRNAAVHCCARRCNISDGRWKSDFFIIFQNNPDLSHTHTHTRTHTHTHTPPSPSDAVTSLTAKIKKNAFVNTYQHTCAHTVCVYWSTELTQQECQHTSTLAQPKAAAAAAMHLSSSARQQLTT